MTFIVDLCVLSVCLCVTAPIAMFVLEVWCGLIRRRTMNVASPETAPSTAVLIPAHNEEVLIARTLEIMMPTINDATRVVVIADNCTDKTAEIAVKAGAEVVERFHETERGKGYALAYGVEHLKSNPPKVVVIVDADCVVREDTISGLAASVAVHDRPVQGLNLTDLTPGKDGKQILALLGNKFTNLIRPLGLEHLGVPCQLTGTGMALPYDIVKDGRLATGDLVEDMKLGIDLTIEGRGPIFDPRFKVASAVPADDAAFDTQRTRWEQGHIRTLTTQVPRLVSAAIKHRSMSLLATAFDLAIPPLALLAVLWLIAFLVAAPAALAGFSVIPFWVLILGAIAMTSSIFAGWKSFCADEIPFSALVAIPGYVCRKLPMYAKLLIKKGEQSWVRTAR